ncbi:hypothetical protein M0804_004328 [Polistes exclamans]|nr:hypothetical protein M0804_004328 [Polistes exclamans]
MIEKARKTIGDLRLPPPDLRDGTFIKVFLVGVQSFNPFYSLIISEQDSKRIVTINSCVLKPRDVPRAKTPVVCERMSMRLREKERERKRKAGRETIASSMVRAAGALDPTGPVLLGFPRSSSLRDSQ